MCCPPLTPVCLLTAQGMVNVIGSIVGREGVASLWKGFLPYFSRLGPHTVLTFIFVEQMTAAYQRLYSR